MMTNVNETNEDMQNEIFAEDLPNEHNVNDFTSNEGEARDDLLLDDESIASNCNKRRGEYGFYPPNLRIRIAKMALEKGVSKTANHFSDDLGRYVSPSTVASIRNQYLKEVSQCIEENLVQISELPKAETGRPLLLEELDLHILQCVQKIKESGGAVNAAVIKRIARDIIIANNKSLLLEYGGPFELSNAWAEHTLKRITNTDGRKQRSNKSGLTDETSRTPSPGLEEMKQAYVDIITSAVTTHGLSKELIPTVSPVASKRRRSQREQIRTSSASPDPEAEKNSVPDDEILKKSDEIDSEQRNSNKSKNTKYKLKTCPLSKGKSQKRFRILKVPTRNSTRGQRKTSPSSSQHNKCKNVSTDCSNTEIPENELIEMAIPCMAGKRKRGDYATYTSEQRISMAKMALEIGVAKTAQHFSTKLGRYVSPSSVASMRNQYRRELEKTRNEVVELPKGKRGRPLLLGHLDSEIKRAIESIKNTGGKIGRNVVKSIARDIILANNRGLLKENGGPLQLTNTWAESVMKRMGFVRHRKNNKTSSSIKVNMSKGQTKGVKNLSNEFEELNQAYMDVINNAVNTAVSTHGLTDDVVANYDQYQTQNLPLPHIGSHNFIPSHHSITSSHNGFNMEVSLNRNNQSSVQSQNEQETLMNLNNLRTSVENFPNSYNSYYGNWAQSSNRDYSLMGSYNQSISGSGMYSSQIDPSFLHQHQQGIDRQPLPNGMSRESIDLSVVNSGNYSSSMSSIVQTCNSRNSIQTLGSCENVNSSLPSQLDETSSLVLSSSDSLTTHIMSSSKENVTNPVEDNLNVENDIHPEANLNENSFSSEAKNEKEQIDSTNNEVLQSDSKDEAREGKKSTKTKKEKDTKRKRGEYGVYTSEQRMKMARLALDYGVTKAANIISEELGRVVSSSTVASMRNLYLRELEKTNEEISELPKGKRGRPLLLGDLDSQIQRCLMNIRINGGVITRMVVVSVARGIILAKNKSLLKEYGGPVELSTTWAESVIRRMGFVRQKNDGSVMILPPDFDSLKSAFLKRITSTVMTNSIPKDLILNFGQTPLKIVPSSSWTTEGQNNQQIPNLEIEDRREITSILTISLAGNLLPIQLIYTGKTDQCHPNIPFPEGWSITHTENHLCTSETMMQYAEKLLIPYIIRTRSLLGLSSSHKALVIFDVLNMNQDKEFFTKLRENNIEVILVPTPCTSLLQPLELTVFGRFRDELYKFFFNWYSTEVCEAVRAGQNPSSVIVDLRLSVLKHLHAQWILKTHELLCGQRNLILEGFGNAGVIEALSTAARNLSQAHY